MQAWAFECHFGFGKADGHFDLPAASVSEDDAPGIFWGLDCLGSEEVPGFAA